jgi:hypothetical protein
MHGIGVASLTRERTAAGWEIVSSMGPARRPAGRRRPVRSQRAVRSDGWARVKALDTNVLVHAEITTSPFHTRARTLLGGLAEGRAPWALPWPCVYEFLRVVTHPRVYHPPMPIADAMADLRAILDGVRVLTHAPSL